MREFPGRGRGWGPEQGFKRAQVHGMRRHEMRDLEVSGRRTTKGRPSTESDRRLSSDVIRQTHPERSAGPDLR